jgi:hypothetical protein
MNDPANRFAYLYVEAALVLACVCMVAAIVQGAL